MIFLFFYLPACHKTAEILPLTTTLNAHLSSQFSHVFALLFLLCHVLKALIFAKIGVKFGNFCKKNCKVSERWGLCLTPLPPAVPSVADLPLLN